MSGTTCALTPGTPWWLRVTSVAGLLTWVRSPGRQRTAPWNPSGHASPLCGPGLESLLSVAKVKKNCAYLLGLLRLTPKHLYRTC